MLWPLLALSLAAQDPHAGHEPARPEVVQIAARPLPLRTGIGSAHDPVGARSKNAQAFYDQGLAYLHSYVWLEAARSFNHALTLDPTLAVAHAMLSIAYMELNVPGSARDALERARALAGRASDHDRRHIEARTLQAAAERAGRNSVALHTYRAALDEDVAQFPADEEFRLLRGMAESPDPAERGQGSVAASVPFYQHAATLAPTHFAAHHYLTHAFENAGRTNEALAESATYARMAPEVPHARHMHGHALRRVGRIDAAIEEFSAADALETAYFKTERIPVELDWHYQHNVDLLGTSYQYVGQMRKAEALLKTSFAIDSSLVEQEFNKREWPMFLLARGRTQEAVDAARVMAAHRSPLVSAAGHVMLGETRLALGQFQAAAQEANAALRLMRGAPEGAGLVANSLQTLQGEFLLRTGQREKGRAMLSDVTAKIRSVPGPDAWTQALFTLEAIARAAREAGDWDFAGRAARQVLAHDANYAGGHYALALVAQHNGDLAEARTRFERAAQLWAQADPDLPELRPLRSR